MGTRSGRASSVVIAVLAALAATLVPRAVAADEVAVPLPVQADLLAKAAAYDRNFGARAGAVVRDLLIARPGNILSERVAQQMATALKAFDEIGGLPHADEVVDAADASSIGSLCRDHHTAIVYIAPGYDEAQVRAIAASLSGMDILSVAATPAYVQEGIVFGFDVSAGRPKLLAHLGQARLQHVQFEARLLKLMRTYE